MKLFMRFVFAWLICCGAFFITDNASATEQAITQVDLIFDASGSMSKQVDGKTQIQIAREAMKVLLAELSKDKNTHLGLRVYGHLNNRCDNSVLEVPIGEGNANKIQSMIDSIKPKGKTPIAYSLLQSINDFNHKASGKKIIVLITDGVENCGGKICAAALKLKKAGIFTGVHVVGIGMKKDELATLNCVAAPFGGKVIGASNAAELVGAFKVISKEVAVDKNLEIIGGDKTGKAVYMDVVVYQNNKEVAKSSGVAPSFKLKAGTYSITAKSHDTQMEIKRENIKVEESKKTTIKLIFAQSSFSFKSLGNNNKPIYAFYTIYKAGTKEEVAKTSGEGEVSKTILPGIYDIKAYEQDTYSSLWVKNITIKAGDTYKNIFKFTMGKISLVPQTADGKVSAQYWWYNFYKDGSATKEKNAPEGVGKKEAELMPGVYSLKVLDDYNNVVKEIDGITIIGDKSLTLNVEVPK